MVCRLSKEYFFESAHTLPKVPVTHKCYRMHGHSYRVEISVEGEVDPETGWLYDHSIISNVMDPIVDELDHFYLNDIAGLENPTVENLCAWVWNRVKPQLSGLCEIVIQETPTARCTYRGL